MPRRYRGVTASPLRQLARAGRLPTVRHACHWFYRRAAGQIIANARGRGTLAVSVVDGCTGRM
jgi:hypothetical protein